MVTTETNRFWFLDVYQYMKDTTADITVTVTLGTKDITDIPAGSAAETAFIAAFEACMATFVASAGICAHTVVAGDVVVDSIAENTKTVGADQHTNIKAVDVEFTPPMPWSRRPAVWHTRCRARERTPTHRSQVLACAP